ncbi:hypothetical protein H7I01_06600 [Mycobacterium palustre]|uniref:Uncharacterized protein n=1 Tax=Mycobacterium palustre TaxID=153971 RepID=A0A1X1ZBZ5_9MYCO|nr:hypothetical protein [Mycobacterium palustre]ORW20923.1 hypothetical protein AWC19_14260 [Mycobacterium palustre]
MTVRGRTASGGDWHIERRTPGLLADLNDVALRRTRMGSGSGHRKPGDEMPALYEPDTEQGKATRQEQARLLLDIARNTLSTIVRDICETRGVEPPRATSVDAARFLAAHVGALACDEAAGQWKSEIDALVRRIERTLERPPTPRFCGPCTHYVEHNRHCGKLLYAKREAVEVTCGACKTTHNIERLTRNLENRAATMRFTSAEILIIMHTLGTPIPERTWSRWRKEERVKIRGYKRPDNPDGTRGAVRLHRLSDDDEPVYRLAEVRKVYAAAIKHTDAIVREAAAAR